MRYSGYQIGYFVWGRLLTGLILRMVWNCVWNCVQRVFSFVAWVIVFLLVWLVGVVGLVLYFLLKFFRDRTLHVIATLAYVGDVCPMLLYQTFTVFLLPAIPLPSLTFLPCSHPSSFLPSVPLLLPGFLLSTPFCSAMDNFCSANCSLSETLTTSTQSSQTCA